MKIKVLLKISVAINVFLLVAVLVLISVDVKHNNTGVDPQNDYLTMNAAEHVISHRGASGEEKEHTFEAYDLAIGYGARYIEQDLVFSSEGTLFVSHDLYSSLYTGEERQISSFSDDELSSFGLLKLQDVIERYKGETTFVIEVRQQWRDSFNGISQAQSLIEYIEKYDISDRVIVQAWDIDSLKTIKDYNNDILTMYLTDKEEGVDIGIDSKYVDIICTCKELMNSYIVNKVHNASKKYCVYTVNSMEEIKNAIECDADLYFTNYVAKALLLEKKFR